MARLKLGIIFGGVSEEHPVSLKSAREVAQNLDLGKYEPFYIGISEHGEWKLCEGPDAGWESTSGSSPRTRSSTLTGSTTRSSSSRPVRGRPSASAR